MQMDELRRDSVRFSFIGSSPYEVIWVFFISLLG